MSYIEAATLTTFEVADDGTRFQINIQSQSGEHASVSMPTECLQKLIMTLPNVLRKALWNQFRDSSLRLVYPLAETRIEKAAGRDVLIVTSATTDGFEVSFEYSQRQLDELTGAVAGLDLSRSDYSGRARKLD